MADPVTCIGMLPLGEHTAVRVARLLAGERRRRGTRPGRRGRLPEVQAVLVLRWLADATRLAGDNRSSLVTADRYRPEDIAVLTAGGRRGDPARCWPHGPLGTATGSATARSGAPTEARPSA